MGITIGGTRTRTSAAEDEGEVRGSRYRRSAPAEDESPRRGRRRDAEPDEAPARSSRRGRGRDDEDSGSNRRSRGRGGDAEPAPKREAQRGWSSSKKVREETGGFANRFKLSEDDYQLIMFLEDDPFDSAARHFIREIREGQKMFVCPGKKGPYKCPLCALGDSPMAVSFFNIVVLDEKGDPEVKVWECGPGFITEIDTQRGSRAVNDHLSSVYFEVKGYKRGNSKAMNLEINLVRPRDLGAEWHIQPLTEAELDELFEETQGEGYVKLAPESTLRAAAEQLDRLGD